MEFVTNFWLNKQVKVNIFDDGNISVPNQNNIWRVTDIIFNGDKLQVLMLDGCDIIRISVISDQTKT